MELIELMNLANKGYGDGMVAEYYDPVTGEFKANPDGGDKLAEFVAAELGDCFEDEAGDTQLIDAVDYMEKAIKDLQNVIDALEGELYSGKYPQQEGG